MFVFVLVAAAADAACIQIAKSGVPEMYCHQGSLGDIDPDLMEDWVFDEREGFCVKHADTSTCDLTRPDGYGCWKVYYDEFPDVGFNQHTDGYPIYSDDFCEIVECEDDDDCEDEGRGYSRNEYCSEVDLICVPEFCDGWTSCDSDSICDDGFCTHMEDLDGDGVLGTMWNDIGLPVTFRNRLYQMNPSLFDCHDGNMFCTDDCVSDVDLDFNKDCADVCIDRDGDGACDVMSIMALPEGFERDPDTGSYISPETRAFMESVWDFEVLPVEQFSGDGLIEQFWDTKYPVFTLFSVEDPMDCDDGDPEVYPTRTEVCNNIDDDCDKQVDECAPVSASWVAPSDVCGAMPGTGPVGDRAEGELSRSCAYTELEPAVTCKVVDYDGDGYGNWCIECPDCHDCNDGNSNVFPMQFDGRPDGVDDNCNGRDGEMADLDPGAPDDHMDVFEDEDLECARQGRGQDEIVDHSGCWISNINGNLLGWDG